MANNPFEPPRSGFNKPPTNREPGSIFKAVLLGAGTDIGGTMICGIIIGIGYAILLGLQGMDTAQVEEAFTKLNDLTSPIGLLLTAVGLTMSLLGGYVCARVANVLSYTPVGIMSMIGVAYGTISSVSDGNYQWTKLLALTVISVVANFAGGWWWIRTIPRE